jgi:drug/metabolite transporter (DMT)-like permease
MPLPSAFSSRLRNLPGPIRAGLWIALSSTGFTGMMAIARELSSDLPILVIVLFRSLFGLVFLSPYVMRNGIGALRTTRIGLYLMRGFCAYTGLTCLFFAVTYISLAEVSAINFTRPIFGAIAAIIFLGEVARARRWVAIFAGFAGALIIIRPGFQDINPGVLFALGSAGR